jgi:EAL domain-containing protein (putative c-di-GMP-specific phosphodiesterase class I)
MNPYFIDQVADILRETGLAPQYLELEITESMTAEVEEAIEALDRLKSLGVKISMDDFGTGYSSLHYLKKFSIDKLKIDQSFVCDITHNSKDGSIVKTIIDMVHNLQLRVIAEGVETREQLEFLQEKQCDDVQGYLISHPLPADEAVFIFNEKSYEGYAFQ